MGVVTYASGMRGVSEPITIEWLPGSGPAAEKPAGLGALATGAFVFARLLQGVESNFSISWGALFWYAVLVSVLNLTVVMRRRRIER